MNTFLRKFALVGTATLLTSSILGLGACAATQDSGQLQAHKHIIRALFESVWNDADFDAIEGLWAQEVTFHFRGQSFPVSRAGLRDQVTSWREAFPDFQFVVEDVVAEADRVAARVSFTGTHTGAEWFGLAATGKPISVTEMMFFRLEAGVVVEAWEDYDEQVMRQQLGAP